MARKFLLSLVLFFTANISYAAQPKDIVLLTVGVNNVAVETDSPDRFAEEANMVQSAIMDNPICRTCNFHVLSKEATHDNLLLGLNWVKVSVNRNSLAIIYITAHGGYDENGYYCCMADAKVYGSEIRRIVDHLPCKVLLIIDTCHAAAYLDGGERPNVFVIAACKKHESAKVWYVAKPFALALQDADRNCNGVIDSDELYEYLTTHVKGPQHVVRSKTHFTLDMMRRIPRKSPGLPRGFWIPNTLRTAQGMFPEAGDAYLVDRPANSSRNPFHHDEDEWRLVALRNCTKRWRVPALQCTHTSRLEPL